MKDITSIYEFEALLEQISDYVVESGLNNCISENNYIFDYADISHLINESDYERYLPLIADYISSREEVLDIDIATGKLDIIYGLKYCKFYEDTLKNEKSIDCGKWHVELLDKNDPYGNSRLRDGISLERPLWDYEKPGVAFYDTSQDPNKFPGGQFTYTYFVDTLRGTDGYGTRADQGLRMDFDVPAWTVQKEDMQNILHWLDCVMESRTLEALCRNEEELCVKLNNGCYFHLQTCDDGWDYTFYDKSYAEIDGGQLDNPEYSMEEAVRELLEDYNFSSEQLTPISLDDLITHVEEAEFKQFQKLQMKINIAEDRAQLNQAESQHSYPSKNIPERI